MTGNVPLSAARRLSTALAVCGLLVLSAGCQNDDIQHYQVNRADENRQRSVGDVHYTVPQGWRPTKAGQMSLAAFLVSEGNQQAEVTISAFGGPAGGLLPNINRWRGQLGLPELDEAQLEKDKDVKKISVNDTPAHLVTLTGQHGESILGAIVPRADKTWFFKMKGPADLIDKQKTAFDTFLASVQFAKG